MLGVLLSVVFEVLIPGLNQKILMFFDYFKNSQLLLFFKIHQILDPQIRVEPYFSHTITFSNMNLWWLIPFF